VNGIREAFRAPFLGEGSGNENIELSDVKECGDSLTVIDTVLQ
jgi:hypothetical protein